MNCILIELDDFIDRHLKKVCLKDRRAQHIRDILKSQPGDVLSVGQVGGKMGAGSIIALSDDSVILEVSLTRSPPASLPLTLVLALPRPIVMKRLLPAISAMGIKEIHLIGARRVEKSFWKSPVLEPEKVRTQLILGLEQSRDTILPNVQCYPLFKPFVEDMLPTLMAHSTTLLALPGAKSPCPKDIKTPITLIIGPEAEWIPYEVERLINLGVSAVHLGARTLRTETAIPLAIGRLF